MKLNIKNRYFIGFLALIIIAAAAFGWFKFKKEPDPYFVISVDNPNINYIEQKANIKLPKSFVVLQSAKQNKFPYLFVMVKINTVDDKLFLANFNNTRFSQGRLTDCALSLVEWFKIDEKKVEKVLIDYQPVKDVLAVTDILSVIIMKSENNERVVYLSILDETYSN